MNKANIKIDNRGILIDFLQFIEPEDNVDILFSAPFGSGKTHFFQKDFAKEVNRTSDTKNAYNVFHLFPVNYSVASNEDIYELIKYDILQECVARHFDLIENDATLNFSLLLKVGSYFQSKFDIIKFVNGILKKAAICTNSPEVKFAHGTVGLIKFLQNEWKNVEGEFCKTEEEMFTSYFKSLQEDVGIYENDKITKFIRSFLKKIKETNKKKNILIIDDLDRIDPEHIFRLFNMFSSHKDYQTQEHKFGFDKIVFVCDISNISKIYHHKYGMEVDFYGYISKFVSSTIYHFNNKEEISRQLHSIMNSYIDNLDINHRRFVEPYKGDINLFIYLIHMLISLGKISLRDLGNVKQFNEFELQLYSDYDRFDVVRILMDKFLGGAGKFKNIIQELNKNEVNYTFLQSNENRNFVENVYSRLMWYVVKKRSDFGSFSGTYEVMEGFKILIRSNEALPENKIALIDFNQGAFNKFDLIKFLKCNID